MARAGTYDFSIDGGSRWSPRMTWFVDEARTEPVNLTGFEARLTVVQAGFGDDPVLALATPDDITLGGVLGTVSWFVPKPTVLTKLVVPVFDYDLTLLPDGDEDQAFEFLTGQVLVRLKPAP